MKKLILITLMTAFTVPATANLTNLDREALIAVSKVIETFTEDFGFGCEVIYEKREVPPGNYSYSTDKAHKSVTKKVQLKVNDTIICEKVIELKGCKITSITTDLPKVNSTLCW